MLSLTDIFGQQSFSLSGNYSSLFGKAFRELSYEANPGNYSLTKDWELQLIAGSLSNSNGGGVASDIYSIMLGKRLGDHYLSGRYTPVYKKEFIITSGGNLDIGDTSEVLNTSLGYYEKFALGYSYMISPKLNLGFTFRFFEQEASKEELEFVFSDTVNQVRKISTNLRKRNWRGDIGLSYLLSPDLLVNISSNNLFSLNENGSLEDYSAYELLDEKSFTFGIDWRMNERLSSTLLYESTNSFIAGLYSGWNIWGGKLILGVAANHDKYQQPFIASVTPSLSYSKDFFSINISGIKYSEERSGTKQLSQLGQNGLTNIINNRYSNDKVVAMISFALSFVKEQKVKFKDLKLSEQIYPAHDEYYFNNPIAIGIVENISDEPVSVKPSTIIEYLNEEPIYSPSVTIPPGESVEIPFYISFEMDYEKYKSRRIGEAKFLLTTGNSFTDDEIIRPILINSRNSWDGSVTNLRFFVRNSFSFAHDYSRSIISQNKTELDSIGEQVRSFEIVKLLFSEFVSGLQYVSDPRASNEYVQYTDETIALKGGDCDDLSVGFASLLESVGIQTAFVDYKEKEGINHVALMVNTGISPEFSSLITKNDKKFFVRTNTSGVDQIWIPIEMTSLTEFEKAWNLGASKFYKEGIDELGLVKGNVKIIDIY